QEPETGGHFPSLEVPDHFVRDLQEGLAAVLAATRTATPSGGTM
ncbi:epoxide hydrolase, partial [Rhodococcus hoagii]|nr:epoxide hydrolase [Prescottella equi]